MVGMERSVLPLVGEREFGLESKTVVLSFVVAFGAAKALANLAAGALAQARGRRYALVLGWLLALPVPLLLAVADRWSVVVAANVLLGASQGLTWSMTMLMKLDVAGRARRGAVVGLNESAGYVGVAAAALATGGLAGVYAPRTVVWVGAAVVAAAGAVAALLLVRDTSPHVEREHVTLVGPTIRRPTWTCSQAGFATNLNDALMWGLAPLYLAARGASPAKIGVVAATYPAVWGLGQVGTGVLADRIGRRAPIVVGWSFRAGRSCSCSPRAAPSPRRSRRPWRWAWGRRSPTRRCSRPYPTRRRRGNERRSWPRIASGATRGSSQARSWRASPRIRSEPVRRSQESASRR